jgi:tRNA-dihydrouridine synthase
MGLIEDYRRWILAHYQGNAQIKALRRTLFVLTRGLPGSNHFRQQVGLARSLEVLQGLFELYFAGLAGGETGADLDADHPQPDPLPTREREFIRV